MVSILDPKRVIAKDIKLYLLLLCQLRDNNSMSRGDTMPKTGAKESHISYDIGIIVLL